MCGLDNVYLENGYTIKKTAYGEGISIHDMEGLHEAIAYNIITKLRKLNGDEIRYLRKELELSQKGLSILLDVSENTIRGWENSRSSISGSANTLMRIIYLENIGKNEKIINFIERLNKLDEEFNKITLSEKNNHWVAQVA